MSHHQGGGGFSQGHLHELLADMEHWDKDKRFMGASDLTTEICALSGGGGHGSGGQWGNHHMQGQMSQYQQQQLPLDFNMQKRISQAFLKQLEDNIVEVQGNAVKCLARILVKFNDQLVGEAVAKLAQLVLEGKDEVRDIYATCLKGLLPEMSQNCSTIVCNQVLPRMLHGISALQDDVKEQCVDVLAEVLKRYGNLKAWITEQEKITQALLQLLHMQQKSSLRKKATSCIGILSVFLVNRQLDYLTRILLQGVRNAPTKQEKQLYIHCIGTVSRSVGLAQVSSAKLGQGGGNNNNNVNSAQSFSFIHEIAPLFLQICEQCTQDGAEHDDQDHEVVENCLNAFEAFINKSSQKDLEQFINPLFDLLLKLMRYDPNFYAPGGASGSDNDNDVPMDQDNDFEDDSDDDDDDYEEDSEDDDSSWKVRRAALRVVIAMVKSLPQRLPVIYEKFGPAIVQRFSMEREQTVKQDWFSVMEVMLKAATEQGGGANGGVNMLGGASSVTNAQQQQLQQSQMAAAQAQQGGSSGSGSHSNQQGGHGHHGQHQGGHQSGFGSSSPSNAGPMQMDPMHPGGGIMLADVMVNGLGNGIGDIDLEGRARTKRRKIGPTRQDSTQIDTGPGSQAFYWNQRKQFSNCNNQYQTLNFLKPGSEKLVELIPKIVQTVSKQLLSQQGGSSSKATVSRAGAFSLLRVLAQLLPTYLEPSLLFLEKALLKGLQDSNSSIQLDTLIILKSQVYNYGNARIYQKLAQSLFPVLINVCNGQYYKTISEAMRVIGGFMHPLRESEYQDWSSGAGGQLASSSGEEQQMGNGHSLHGTKDADNDTDMLSGNTGNGALGQSTGGSSTQGDLSLILNLIPSVYQVVNQKIEKTDIDQDVKECTLECLGHVLACTGDIPAFAWDVQKSLAPFVDRMRNELTRSTAMKALKTITLSVYGTVPIDSNTLYTMCQYLCTYLQQNSRTLRQQSLDCLGCVIRKYRRQMSRETHILCVGSVNSFIQESDLYLTDLAMQVLINSLAQMNAFSQGTGGDVQSIQIQQQQKELFRVEISKVIQEQCLGSILKCCRSPLLQGGALNSILKFFNLVSYGEQQAGGLNQQGQQPLPGHFDVNGIYQQLVDIQPLSQTISTTQAARTVIANLAKCLAALTVVSPNPQNMLRDYINTLENSQQVHPLSIELALLSLGEIGKYMDLSKYTSTTNAGVTIDQLLFNQLQAENDDITNAAALALGYSTMGSPDKFLALLIERISGVQGSKQQYLLLTSFREVITLDLANQYQSYYNNYSQTQALFAQPANLQKLIQILEHHSQAEEDSVRTIVAECLGHLLLLNLNMSTQQQQNQNPSQVENLNPAVQLLQRMFQNKQSPQVRATACQSIRFAAAKGVGEKTLQPIKTEFLNCFHDDDILQVRRAAMHCASVILTSKADRGRHRLASIILDDYAVKLMNQIVNHDGKVRPELIREVDLGPFKHKVDDGLPLRKLSFTVLNDLLVASTAPNVVLQNGKKELNQQQNQSPEAQITSLLETPTNPETQSTNLFDFLREALTDQEDIQVLVCVILRSLASSNNPSYQRLLLQYLDRFQEPFERTIQQQMRQLAMKGQNSGKALDLLRHYVTTIRQLVICVSMSYNQQSAQQQQPNAGQQGQQGQPQQMQMMQHKNFLEFYARLQKDPTFYQLLELSGNGQDQ